MVSSVSFLVIEVALSLEIKDDFAWVLEFPVLGRSFAARVEGTNTWVHSLTLQCVKMEAETVGHFCLP